MNYNYVGVGEYAASRTQGDIVRTLALGSCLAVILLDTERRSVGMVHIALPESSINKKRAAERPGMFVDTGIPALLEEMNEFGYNGSNSLIVKLAGGASIIDTNNTFNIGKRNILAARKLLWRHGLGAIAEEVGGNMSRSVSVEVNTGRVLVSSPGRGERKL
jgi:chemotaxis protein CheD